MKWTYLSLLCLFFGMPEGFSNRDHASNNHAHIKGGGLDSLPNNGVSRVDIFSGGSIDFQTNGQMNASARIVKFFIGDPDELAIPLCLYSGVTANNRFDFQSGYYRMTEQLAINLITPLSGLVNLFADRIFYLKSKKLTKVSIRTEVGIKVIPASPAYQNRATNVFCSYLNSGIFLETGAWEIGKKQEMGLFWLAYKLHYVRPSHSFQAISGEPPDEINFFGSSTGIGVHISKLLNLRAFYYRYFKFNDLMFQSPIYQLSFNYSMKG